MLGEKTLEALTDFGDEVVRASKNNLRREKKRASGALYESIKHDTKVHKNSFSLTFEMEDYWDFVDSGVKGVGGTKADGTRWKLKRVTTNKFKYTNKRPPIFPQLNSWTIRKGIAPRSKGGQFTKRKGLLFAISNSIFHTGLETTLFFTEPFKKEFKNLPDELTRAYSLEVDSFLEQITQ